MSVVLLQIPFAHFDEKARWALDYKGVVHTRRNVTLGRHRRLARRLTGVTRMPVLIYNDEVVSGSHNVVLRLERKFPDSRRLLPVDDRERSAALAIAETLDATLGVAVQTLAARHRRGHPFRSAVYAALAPLKSSLRGERGAPGPETVAAAARELARAFDRIGARVNGHGYLVGPRFTIADLTAAALLAPVADVDHPDMRRPEPVCEPLRALRSAYADHPTAAWVREIYRRHRPRADDHAARRAPGRGGLQ